MKILVLHRIPYHKIEYARGIDHEAHDVTYVGTAEIIATLPEWLRCERIERPGKGDVVEETLAAVQDREFDKVISLSEYELIAASRVRQALGIAGPKEEVVLKVRDKVIMKEAVAAAGIRVPRFLRCDKWLNAKDRAALAWTGPTILKPVDGASSENVVLFVDFDDMVVRMEAGTLPVTHFKADRYEMEEYVAGPILHIDGLMRDGMLGVGLVSQYLGTCLDYANGKPLGSFQWDDVESSQLLPWAEIILKAVGLRDGAFHLEAILTDDGPVFLEVGARVGGADVVNTFEMATGIHLPSAELRLILRDPNMPVSFAGKPQRDRFGWFVFPGHHLQEGGCQIMGAQRFRSHANTVRWFELKADAKLPRTITYHAHLVPVAGILKGRDSEQLRRAMKDVFETVLIFPTGNWNQAISA